MRHRTIYVTLAASLSLGGCADLLSFPDYRAPQGTGGSTTTTSTGAGGSSMGGSGGASTISSTTSSTGSTTSSVVGGAGGSAPMTCTPNSTASCYGGPAETLDIGVCRAGTKTCEADGMGYGPCVGEVRPMIEGCATPAIDESCDGLATCTGKLRWAKSIGDAASQRGTAIAASADGRVVVVGSGAGTIDLGGGPIAGGTDQDAIIAAYGPLGQPSWSRRMGDIQPQSATGVAVDPAGDVVVVGVMVGAVDFGDGAPQSAAGDNGFVARYDRDGALRWAKVLHAATRVDANAVAVGADGATYVAGQFDGSFAVDACPAITGVAQGGFVLRLDASGTCSWLDGFTNPKKANATTIALDAAGSVIVAGTYDEQAIDIGGNVLPNGGGDDTFVAKLAQLTGAVTWAKGLSGAGEQSPWGIGAAPNGTVFVAGRYTGASMFGGATLFTPAVVDAWLVALDGATGTTSQVSVFGGAGGDYGQALAVDGAGDVILGVNSSGAITFDKAYANQGAFDAYVAKIDATTFAARWVKQIGGAASASLFGLATDGTGRVLVGGTTDGAFDIDGVQVPGNGGQDLFVLGLAP